MLANKIALVTGASRGIGREIAVSLAKEGAYVFINYSGNEEAAKETLNLIQKDHIGDGELCKCDVGNFLEVKALIENIIEKKQRIDIVVNNAGITRDNLILKMSEKEFDDVLNTNLKGTFNTIKHASKYMLKQREGHIINISSISGVIGNAGQSNYSAAKAGVIGLTKAVAKELASRGITVNAVAPGFIQTEMTDSLSDSIKDKVVKSIPLGRFGSTKDIADMVVYLASEKGNYITGQVFQVDGGLS